MTWKTHEHPLAHPIEIGDKKVETIVLREPDVEALETIGELNLPVPELDASGVPIIEVPLTIRQLRVIITAIADQPDEVIRKLHRSDFVALSEAALPLLEPPAKPAASPPSAEPGDSSATE